VESVNDLLWRVGQVWDETQSTAQDTVWITHAGVIRAAMLLAQGLRQLQQAAQWPAEAPAFGGWTLLEH
jgi:alpha-ribazole phosphatase